MSTLILDSFCKLPASFLLENQIKVINIDFYVNEFNYPFELYSRNDYLNFFENEFIIDENPINIQDVQELFTSYLSKGEDVLYVSTIDKKSINAYDVNEMIDRIKNQYSGKITTIHLPSTFLGVRNVILDILEMRKNKECDERIKYKIEKQIDSYSMLTLLDDKKIIAKYNERPTQSINFGIKPIYFSKLNKKMELVCREDGLTNGINKIVDILTSLKDFDCKEISIQYAKSAKHAELLERLLRKHFKENIKIEKVFMDPISIQEFGLGAINVAFKGDI